MNYCYYWRNCSLMIMTIEIIGHCCVIGGFTIFSILSEIILLIKIDHYIEPKSISPAVITYSTFIYCL